MIHISIVNRFCFGEGLVQFNPRILVPVYKLHQFLLANGQKFCRQLIPGQICSGKGKFFLSGLRGQMFDVGQGNGFIPTLREGVQNGVFQNIVGKMLHLESAAAHVAFGRKAQKRMFVGRVSTRN